MIDLLADDEAFLELSFLYPDVVMKSDVPLKSLNLYNLANSCRASVTFRDKKWLLVSEDLSDGIGYRPRVFLNEWYRWTSLHRRNLHILETSWPMTTVYNLFWNTNDNDFQVEVYAY